MANSPTRTLIDRLDTRSFIAIALTISMIALTFVLALRGPETDAFKVLLGAMLTVGFASAIGWYFNSNAGSDKKDETLAQAAQELAKKVPVAVASAATPAVVVSWWSLLEQTEKDAIDAASKTDTRVADILAALQSGKAEAPDINDLVAKGLITQARASLIMGV